MSDIPIWKRTYWKCYGKLRALAFWLTAGIPGALGVRVRPFVFRSVLKSLGRDVVIQRGMRLVCPDNISIGSNCNFAQDVFITGGGGVTIGDWVGFGPGTKIWSINHRFDDPNRPWLLQGHELKPVVIEDDVWLGANVFVAPGVTIGRGVIVSAGAVVNKSIPAFALVGGNPGRVIGWRKKPELVGGRTAEETAAIAG
jgi:maltose O-acetyltransferase